MKINFALGMGLGMAAGAAAAMSLSQSKQREIKRTAGKAVKAVENAVDDLSCHMGS